jgi:hypothetical protein
MKKRNLIISLLLLCGGAFAQVNVALAPPNHPQFFNSSGLPLSGGFIYTYLAGTTTLSNTYADSTGTVQNTDPILLDASGAPSNGTSQTGIWLANLAYKFCAFDSSMVQQWCTDNVTTYWQLLNFANTWTFQQTFSLPIVERSTDNQFFLGSPGVQTTLDFPPPVTPITLHFPNTDDTIVGRSTLDTLANKTFSDIPKVGTGFVVGGFPVHATICSIGVVALNTVTTSQTVQTCTLPAGVMNSLRATMRIVFEVDTSPSANITQQISYGLSSTANQVTGVVCNELTNFARSCVVHLECTTVITGAGGRLGCNAFATGTMAPDIVEWTAINVDLTSPIFVSSFCQFGGGSANCTGNQLFVEQLN